MLEAETGIIGVTLANPERIEDIISELNVDKFQNENTKKIYEMMVESYSSRGRLVRVEIINYLEEVPEEVKQMIVGTGYGIFDIKDLTEQVKQNWVKGELFNVASTVVEEVKTNDNVKEIIAIAEQAIFAVSQDDRKSHKPVLSLTDGPIMEAFEAYSERLQGRLREAGIQTGFRSIDRHLFGLQRGSLTVVGGSTSAGKSNFVIQTAKQVASRDNKVLLFSLEMPKKQVVDRMVIMAGELNAKDYSSKPSQENHYKVNQAFETITQLGSNFFICDQRGLTILELKSIARQVASQKGLDLVIIDYLQNVKIPSNGEKNYAKHVAEATKEIFNMAGELDLPVVLVSQINRGHVNRKDKTPRMSDFRDSGEIEETADNVILVYNENIEEQKNLWREEPEDVSIIIDKARGALTGAVTFTYDPMNLTFVDPLNNGRLYEEGRQYA